MRAEWTKFRTVRGWVVATAAAAVAMVGLGLTGGMSGSCGQRGPGSECELPVGPDGAEVTDSFTFVHRPLTGDGSVTARVASMTGRLATGRAALPPWAKAGLIVKDGTRPGSSYAAVMLTAAHGVRMQHDYTHDRAGSSGGGPRWLRLTRAGDTITGAESVDGAQWTDVGSVRLDDLPSTVEIGLFATSPQYAEIVSESIGGMGASTEPSRITATFDSVTPGDGWTETVVGELPGRDSQYTRDGDLHTLTGSGDIAPAVSGAAGLGTSITATLVGTFAALIVMVVVGTMMATGEYRRGLIRTTLAATPHRGRVLAAKALVVAAVTFVTGVVAAAVVVTAGQRLLRSSGVYVHPVGTATELRVIAGTGALLAVAAVLALALGTLLRRGTTAVTAAVATIVLPYLLVMAALPVDVGRWVLRVTPAAAFALQQSAKQYDQVANLYIPQDGYFPLPPWAGFGVLAAWTAVALAAAAWLLRRRDA
ncbi:ABC transporter permease subunit [Phytohabitans sp. LJ34]|uniref:ABC transporter permease subunit n=1 Tax=Phytohabitans sp. LJ34 TaxID=3452217 RepID=UPI003F8BB93E